MAGKVRVSILCLAYNQEKFIRQALESIMMQKTNFDLEVLIHDDASTDKTQDIIREFQKKYPNVIKPIFQKENQFSKGVRGVLMKNLLPHAKGEYIAICEGDDFFIDENKLQLQVDFLDKNSDYSICFHPVRVFFEDNEHEESVYPQGKDETFFTEEELVRRNFIQTNSVMYRRQSYKDLPKTNIIPGDWYLHLYHARFGKIGFIKKVMSAYRRHLGGLWWDSDHNIDELLKKQGSFHLTMYLELLKLYDDNPKFKGIILGNMNPMIRKIMEINKEEKARRIIEDVLSDFSDNIPDVVIEYVNKLDKLSNILTEKDKEISHLSQDIHKKDELVTAMRSSIFWKLRDFVVRVRLKLGLTKGWDEEK